MNTVIFQLTDAYSHQDFYQKLDNTSIVDCRHIQGTRCYLDDDAATKLRALVASHPANLRFIDSGNYHYMSLLTAETFTQPFNLILFDHHPDNQPPSFGDITSCGGWVLEAQEKLPHLHQVFTFGVGDMPSIADIPCDLPIFISIDKDVLCTADSITDWDQGTMTLTELLSYLKEIMTGRQVLAVDICGDASENPLDASPVNNQTNTLLVDFLTEYL